MKGMKSGFFKVQWIVAVICSFLVLITGSLPTNAATVNQSHFDVQHTKGKNSTSGVTPNAVVGGGGGGCGNVVNNTGWEDFYSSDGTAMLSMCSYDAGSHTMVTYIRIYNYYGDGISSAYATATYDDNGEDGATAYPAGAAQANMVVEHTFSNGGFHIVNIQGGFSGYDSLGRWDEDQSLTLN